MPDYCISPSGHPRTLSKMLPFWCGAFQCQLPLYPWLGGKCQAWGACILIMWWNKVLLDMFTNTLLPQEAGVSKSSHLAKNLAILELKPNSQRPVGTILILAHFYPKCSSLASSDIPNLLDALNYVLLQSEARASIIYCWFIVFLFIDIRMMDPVAFKVRMSYLYLPMKWRQVGISTSLLPTSSDHVLV